MEVIAPGSKGVQTYIMNRLLVFLYREFRAVEKRGLRPSVRADELSAQFPSLSEAFLRKRLKHCADLQVSVVPIKFVNLYYIWNFYSHLLELKDTKGENKGKIRKCINVSTTVGEKNKRRKRIMNSKKNSFFSCFSSSLVNIKLCSYLVLFLIFPISLLLFLYAFCVLQTNPILFLREDQMDSFCGS